MLRELGREREGGGEREREIVKLLITEDSLYIS